MSRIPTGLKIRIRAQEKVRGDDEGFANETFYTETHLESDIFDVSTGKRRIIETIKPKLLLDVPRKIKITK